MLTRKRHVICCSPARIKVLITFEFTIIRTALRPIQCIGVKSLRTVNHDLVPLITPRIHESTQKLSSIGYGKKPESTSLKYIESLKWQHLI